VAHVRRMVLAAGMCTTYILAVCSSNARTRAAANGKAKGKRPVESEGVVGEWPWRGEGAKRRRGGGLNCGLVVDGGPAPYGTHHFWLSGALSFREA
jgi:hypothetical protein